LAAREGVVAAEEPHAGGAADQVAVEGRPITGTDEDDGGSRAGLDGHPVQCNKPDGTLADGKQGPSEPGLRPRNPCEEGIGGGLPSPPPKISSPAAAPSPPRRRPPRGPGCRSSRRRRGPPPRGPCRRRPPAASLRGTPTAPGSASRRRR